MIPTSSRSWWLLALCSILNAAISGMLFLTLGPDRTPFIHTRSTGAQLGMLALAAGVCTIAAGIWNSGKSASWLLVLNGLVCSAFGLLVRSNGAVTFRTIALLIAVMAVSIGAYELATARALREHHPADKWLLGAAGAISAGFAVAFLAFVLRWLKLEPSPSAQTFHWLGSYFGFSAICMLGLALRQLRPPAMLTLSTS